MIAEPLATPWADWLAPMENRLTMLRCLGGQEVRKKRSRSAVGTPQSAATADTD